MVFILNVNKLDVGTHSDVLTRSPAAESDGDSADWPMEQDEAMDSLLCESPALLPALSLTLPLGPQQAPESPVTTNAAAAAATTPGPTPAESPASSRSPSRAVKVRPVTA